MILAAYLNPFKINQKVNGSTAQLAMATIFFWRMPSSIGRGRKCSDRGILSTAGIGEHSFRKTLRKNIMILLPRAADFYFRKVGRI